MALPNAVCPLWWRGGSLDTIYTLHVLVLYWCTSKSAVRVAGTAASGSAVLGYTSANAPIPLSGRRQGTFLASSILPPTHPIEVQVKVGN